MTGLGVGLFLVAARVVVAFLPHQTVDNDFALAYVEGHAARAGCDPYRTDLMLYNTRAGLPFTAVMGQATNPPLLLLGYRLLAALPPTPAFWFYVFLETASLLVIFVVAGALLQRQLLPAHWCLAAGLSACSLPMFHHYWFTQVQLLLLALILTGIYFWRQGSVVTGCGLLTLAGVLKLYPLAIAPLPILLANREDRRRTILVWLVCLIFWAALPGLAAWASFLRHAAPYLRQFSGGQYLSFTIPSFVNGLCGSQAAAPAWGLAAATLVWAWMRCRQLEFSAAVALLLVVTVLCSAVAWIHYLVFLIFPLLCLAAHTVEATGGRRLLLGALLLLNLAAVNLAGVAPGPPIPALFRYLCANLPVLGMGLLCVHFSRRVHTDRQPGRH